MPALAATAFLRQVVRFHRILQDGRFVLEIARQPMVADPMDGDDVEILVDTTFSCNPQAAVTADGLDVHLVDLEAVTFKQHTVVVQLQRPFHDMMNAVIAELEAVLRLAFLRARLVDFACGDTDFVDAEGFHQLVGAGDFQIAQDAGFVVEQIAVQVKLAARDVIVESHFAEDVLADVLLMQRVDGLTVEGVKDIARIDGIIRSLLQVRLADAGDELRYRWHGQSTVERLRDDFQRREEHAPLGKRAMLQAFRDTDMMPIRADEFFCWHIRDLLRQQAVQLRPRDRCLALGMR